MDFGKLPRVDGIRFELPKDCAHSRLAPAIPSSAGPPSSEDDAGSSPPRVYIGAPVWSCKEWVGKIYPKGTPARDYLRAYAARFNSIELNSTFYRVPDPKTLRGWRDTVRDMRNGFRFAPKVHQSVSHGAGPEAVRSLRAFLDAVREFEETLGSCFLQLPPGFGPARFRDLERLAKAVHGDVSIAFEFRHRDWFKEGCLRRDPFELLTSHGHAAVITDVAGRRDVLHASLTAPRTMIRFVGNELHPSDYSRADDWARRIAGWIQRGVQDVWFFVHHPGYENVPELANYFAKKLTQELERIGIECPALGTSEILPTQADAQLALF